MHLEDVFLFLNLFLQKLFVLHFERLNGVELAEQLVGLADGVPFLINGGLRPRHEHCLVQSLLLNLRGLELGRFLNNNVGVLGDGLVLQR